LLSDEVKVKVVKLVDLTIDAFEALSFIIFFVWEEVIKDLYGCLALFLGFSSVS
jgi:hypothetical protein